MTTKLIERYIITDENNNIIENVNDISKPKLKVYDRKYNEKVIAVLSNDDKDETFIMATAVVEALNNIPDETTITDAVDDSSDG